MTHFLFPKFLQEIVAKGCFEKDAAETINNSIYLLNLHIFFRKRKQLICYLLVSLEFQSRVNSLAFHSRFEFLLDRFTLNFHSKIKL